MAISRQEVVQELKDAHQMFSDAARKIFALMMKVQNMAEEVPPLRGDFTSQELLAAHAAAQANGATEGSASLAAIEGAMKDQGMQLPALGHSSTIVVTNAGQAAAAAQSLQQPLVYPPAVDPTLDRNGATTQPAVFIPQMNTQDVIDAGKQQRMSDALGAAKSIFKEALAARGLPLDLADKVDSVSIEDINRHRAAHGQAPFGEAQQPTEVAPAAQPQMPTEEVKVDEKEMMLACFIGAGSAFAQYLHSDAMFHGKGDFKPGFHPEGAKDPIKRYTQDARWLDEQTLRHWPTGFYTDRDSKMMQLLVNTDQAAFLVGSLPSEVSPVDIFIYGSKQGYRQVQSFEASELRVLHAKLDDAFDALTKKK